MGGGLFEGARSQITRSLAGEIGTGALSPDRSGSPWRAHPRMMLEWVGDTGGSAKSLLQ